jgi:hypothetical protein
VDEEDEAREGEGEQERERENRERERENLSFINFPLLPSSTLLYSLSDELLHS